MQILQEIAFSTGMVKESDIIIKLQIEEIRKFAWAHNIKEINS